MLILITHFILLNSLYDAFLCAFFGNHNAIH